mmetsp:Transcript_89406/g.224829  ORF Transcript_89406/g.224829 Transcript_89406/m.224829 type:complete len:357 (-) Transcript_89406:115-1185(-)
MIGLVLRASGLGGDVGGGGCVALLVALCVAFGLFKCSQCRMRDCPCLKWCLRAAGADSFEDFDLFVVVHEVLVSASDQTEMVVRVHAGEESATTEPHKRVFQQPMSIFVEQGTEKIEVEILDSWGTNRWAKTEVDIDEILKAEGGFRDRVFPMKSSRRGFAQPRVKLTMYKSGSGEDEEEGLLKNIEVSEDHAGMMVRDHLQKVQQAAALASEADGEGETLMKRALSEIELLASACAGYVERLEGWGKKEKVWVAAQRDGKKKKHFFGVWRERRLQEEGEEPVEKLDLLKIKSVQADPRQDISFMIFEMQRDGSTKQHQFFRIDRARDVWVQTLALLIKEARDKKASAKEKDKKAK